MNNYTYLNQVIPIQEQGSLGACGHCGRIHVDGGDEGGVNGTAFPPPQRAKRNEGRVGFVALTLIIHLSNGGSVIRILIRTRTRKQKPDESSETGRKSFLDKRWEVHGLAVPYSSEIIDSSIFLTTARSRVSSHLPDLKFVNIMT